MIQVTYYPVTGLLLVAVLTTLYKLALPHSLPWHRLLPGALLAVVVFIASTTGLRVYIAVLTSSGYTYGALATPIAFLLFGFLLGLSIVLGAHFNHALEVVWPSRTTPSERRSEKLRAAAKRGTGSGRPAAPARPRRRIPRVAGLGPGRLIDSQATPDRGEGARMIDVSESRVRGGGARRR